MSELKHQLMLNKNMSWVPCYLKSEVDAAIAELKAKADELSFDKKLLENHWESEKIRCEAASRNCIKLSNENAKLVSKIESLKVGHRQGIANLKSYYKAKLKQKLEEKDAFIKTLGEGQADLAREIERLKAKLESVQATAYTDSVDAGMRERKLKRALYKALANWAHEAKFDYDDEFSLWDKMERKCLKKAEEYK